MAETDPNMLNVPHKDRRNVRVQFGALCWRMSGGAIEILLITSRGSGRWVIPKGWPMDGKSPEQTALTEAFEEAGVVGDVSPKCEGLYHYTKKRGDIGKPDLTCMVAVYPCYVTDLADDWPEKSERNRGWYRQDQASVMVDEPSLRRLIAEFQPAST